MSYSTIYNTYIFPILFNNTPSVYSQNVCAGITLLNVRLANRTKARRFEPFYYTVVVKRVETRQPRHLW